MKRKITLKTMKDLETQFLETKKIINQIQNNIQNKKNINTDHLHTCVTQFQYILDNIELLEYLMIGQPVSFPKKYVLETLLLLGETFKILFEIECQNDIINARIKTQNITQNGLNTPQNNLFTKSLKCFTTLLQLTPENIQALESITHLYSIKSLLQQHNYPECINNFQLSLSHHPTHPTTHYNIGFIYLKLNRLNEALYHYKLAIKLNPQTEINLFLNCYYGIASVYRTVKQWPQAMYYLLQGLRHTPQDPDLNNQLGVVYTELRRTDLALNCYEIAEKYYKNSIVSTDLTFLLAEIFLNRGHMESYNGNIITSIEYYNKSLQVHPKFLLAFQNKIMNLNYLFDITSDPEYIYKQHLCISKIIDCQLNKIPMYPKINNKWNIGFVSGDFIDHPVSYFITPFLTHFDPNLFNVFCYSENVISKNAFPQANLISSFVIKNQNDTDTLNLIQSHKIHILFDLAGHTAMNRIGVFAKRASPIQISYIGYPNTTGLLNMDYRITDHECDLENIKQRYTEKLLFLNRCFLCYNPTIDKNITLDTNSPFLKNGFITFGCFNRLNKLGPGVIKLWKQLLIEIPDSRILFKTKALLNHKIREKFLNQFDQTLQKRIDIIHCTITHQKHLEIYNQIDLSIDTFPYAGTTTSCESLRMGVPVLTIRDTKTHFHAQNVTHSLLKHSGLERYSFDNINTLVNKVKTFLQWKPDHWKNLKQNISTTFINSNVCDSKNFINDFQKNLLHLLEPPQVSSTIV